MNMTVISSGLNWISISNKLIHARPGIYGFSSDSDAAAPRQTQTDNDASGNPQRVAGRPQPLSVQGTILQLTDQKNLGVPYGIAYRR